MIKLGYDALIPRKRCLGGFVLYSSSIYDCIHSNSCWDPSSKATKAQPYSMHLEGWSFPKARNSHTGMTHISGNSAPTSSPSHFSTSKFAFLLISPRHLKASLHPHKLLDSYVLDAKCSLPHELSNASLYLPPIIESTTIESTLKARQVGLREDRSIVRRS